MKIRNVSAASAVAGLQLKDTDERRPSHSKALTVPAVASTNGFGGGAIMEGTYSVYRCEGISPNPFQCY